MGSKFTVDSSYMLHSGGTKFYQVFRFAREDAGSKVSVSMNHWGSQGTVKPGPRRPISGGEMDLRKADEYLSQIKAKKARGYDTDVMWAETTSFSLGDTLTKFRNHLTTLVGASRRDDILLALGVALSHDEETFEGDDPLPTPALEDTVFEAATTNPLWGSW